MAGEPSGDDLGAALIGGLRRVAPNLELKGIAGPKMRARGMDTLFPMDELSVLGLMEVLPKYFHLKRRIRETAEAAAAWRPDVVVGIDSPDFCLRVQRLARPRARFRSVHYVAPTVWAWRPGRARKMAEVIDHVLALYPFEPPHMTDAGMECDFVGHPVAVRPVPGEEETAAFRRDFEAGGPLLCVLPGSRRGEVSRLLPIFGAVADRLAGWIPDLRIVVPAAAPVAEMIAEAVAGWPGRPILIDPRVLGEAESNALKMDAMAAADAALAASGTVSLELAAVETPAVVAYDLNPITRAIVKRLLLVNSVTLLNIIEGELVIPEFLGRSCDPDLIAPAVAGLLRDPAAGDAQRAAMRRAMDGLGRGGEDPGLRAARAIVRSLGVDPGTERSIPGTSRGDA